MRFKSKQTGYILVMLLFFSAVMSGCLYTKVKAPLDIDTAQTQLGEKVGRASTHCVAWLFAWGNSGVKAAADNGGIATINHLDTEYCFVLFGLYSRQTTIAYGD